MLIIIGITACGGDPEEASNETGSTGHAGGEAHGHGHGHDHDSPEALRPLMRDLRGWMVELRSTLAAGDVEGTREHAHAIAIACDDQNVHDVDADRFGPRFAEIDEELHSAAAQMAEVAEAGDIEAARTRYTDLLTACVSCHEQAPSASAVDLSALALAELE